MGSFIGCRPDWATLYTPRRVCHSNGCCASTYLLPLATAERSLVYVNTYPDIADLGLGRPATAGQDVPAGIAPDVFDERMLPILQPRTIFYQEIGGSHDPKQNSWVKDHAWRIQVPFIMVLGDGDGTLFLTPGLKNALEDPRSSLMHVYSVNTDPEAAAHPNITTIPLVMSNQESCTDRKSVVQLS